MYYSLKNYKYKSCLIKSRTIPKLVKAGRNLSLKQKIMSVSSCISKPFTTDVPSMWIQDIFKLSLLDKTYIRRLQGNLNENNCKWATNRRLIKKSQKHILKMSLRWIFLKFPENLFLILFTYLFIFLHSYINVALSLVTKLSQSCVFNVGFPTKYQRYSNVMFLKLFSKQKSNGVPTSL